MTPVMIPINWWWVHHCAGTLDKENDPYADYDDPDDGEYDEEYDEEDEEYRLYHQPYRVVKPDDDEEYDDKDEVKSVYDFSDDWEIILVIKILLILIGCMFFFIGLIRLNWFGVHDSHFIGYMICFGVITVIFIVISKIIKT